MIQVFDKQERIRLLIALGKEVHLKTLAKHEASGGDPREIVFLDEKIPALVEEYSIHLETYRALHIAQDKLVAGDKIAAFTGSLIMRHEPFESITGIISTRYAAMVNELFALRACELFTRCFRFGVNEARKKQLMRCFTLCNEDDIAMNTWTIAALTPHWEKDSNIRDVAYYD